MKLNHYFESRDFRAETANITQVNSTEEVLEIFDREIPNTTEPKTFQIGKRILLTVYKGTDFFSGTMRIKTTLRSPNIPPIRTEVIEFTDAPRSIVPFYIERFF